MNEEYRRQWIAAFKIITAVIIAILWGFAGIGVDIHRRFMLPLILVLACMVFDTVQKSGKRNDWGWCMLAYLSMLPFYYITMSIFSYGAGSWLRPLGIFLQRLIVGIAWSIPALPVAWVNKKWWIYGVHIFLFTLIMIVLGWGGLLEARSEETLIGFFFAIFVPFMVRYE